MFPMLLHSALRDLLGQGTDQAQTSGSDLDNGTGTDKQARNISAHPHQVLGHIKTAADLLPVALAASQLPGLVPLDLLLVAV